jgi:putative hydrolase of the HAD superfamily
MSQVAKVMVFDLYGVIARNQTDAAKRELERLAGVADGARAAFWECYWACRPAYDAGQPSMDYWGSVAGRLGTGFTDVPALIQTDLASWTEVDERMVTLVGELAAAGRRLGLLSNIIEDLVPIFEARHRGWLAHFDVLVYSCRIGVAKPDPRTYEICAELLQVDPAEIFFLDDRKENVEAARRAGMTAEVFTSPEQARALLLPG